MEIKYCFLRTGAVLFLLYPQQSHDNSIIRINFICIDKNPLTSLYKHSSRQYIFHCGRQAQDMITFFKRKSNHRLLLSIDRRRITKCRLGVRLITGYRCQFEKNDLLFGICLQVFQGWVLGEECCLSSCSRRQEGKMLTTFFFNLRKIIASGVLSVSSWPRAYRRDIYYSNLVSNSELN